MAWVIFILTAVVVVLAAVKLAQYGDVIAVRTGLSGFFIGTLLIAASTSLPELLAAINAIAQGTLDLAAGSMFGSTMFNMMVLGVLDITHQQARILRQVAVTHALTASLAILMAGMAVFFILAEIDWTVGWVGVDSLLIIAVYIGGIRLIQGRGGSGTPTEIDDPTVPSLRRAGVGFLAATLVLILVTPFLVRSAGEIAVLTGLSTGFIGVTLLALVTSLPELVTTFTAVRLGAFDLAVGSLFGSTVFNMFALALTDFFYLQGRYLGAIDPNLALAGLLGLLLVSLGLIGNLARVERRLLFVEIDALLIILGYIAGIVFLFLRGIGV